MEKTIEITEDYVSFETAKLLKEKGFDSDEVGCLGGFYSERCYESGYGIKTNSGKEVGIVYDDLRNCELDYDEYLRPTLQMTMKWLREKHNILLVVDYEYECDNTPYYFKIYRLGENGKPEHVPIKGVSYDKNDNATKHIVGYRDWERSKGDYSTYKEAAEAAIKYCLENLI